MINYGFTGLTLHHIPIAISFHFSIRKFVVFFLIDLYDVCDFIFTDFLLSQLFGHRYIVDVKSKKP